MNKKKLKILFFFEVLLCAFFFQLNAAEWVLNNDIRSIVGIREYIDQAVYGDARNDGINRFYLAGNATWEHGTIEDGGVEGICIYEVFYDAKTSGWVKDVIFYDEEVTRGEKSNIVIADGRNDGVKRLYFMRGYYIDDYWPPSEHVNLIEYAWAGSSWTAVIIDSFDFYFWRMSVGNLQASSVQSAIERTQLGAGKLKNDGKTRIYSSLNGQMDETLEEYVFYEYEYSIETSTWTKSEIVLPSAGAGSILIADGRNDGKEKLYVGSSWLEPGYYSYIWEYGWTGSEWEYTTVGNFYGAASMVIGDGRDDGVNRIYGKHPNDSPSINEASWEDTGWVLRDFDLQTRSEKKKEKSLADDLIVATIADGRNDGVQRVYLAPWFDDNVICELTWNGRGWRRDDYELPKGDYYREAAMFLIERTPGSPVMNKAYTAALREFVYAYPQEPYDPSKTDDDKLQPVNNYFRQRGGWTTVWYKVDKPGNVSVRVYTLDGVPVITLVDKYKQQGVYPALWTGRDSRGNFVGSGIYLVHLNTRGINVTKKICVVK